MPKHIIDFLRVILRISVFKPDFANLRQLISHKLILSLVLTMLAVYGGVAKAADIDMDGVQDGVDIDDDNDGILDSVEGTLIPPTGPVASTSGYTFTPASNPGNIGDTTLYPNAGTFNGTSFDLRLTVVANSDPANLIVDINGYTQAGITYPVALTGTPITGTASIEFEFLISGTATSMQVPSIYTWIDIDADEKITIASNELSEYQLGNPTNISVSSVAGSTTFASSVSGGPTDETQWLRTTLLSNSKFTFQYDKRTGDTGYIWDISTYTSGATPVLLNPEAFYAGDIDGDGIANSNDLDSDNDGISDLVESGTAQSNIMSDADSSGSVSLAEANSALGAGLGDVDGDGLIDLFDADTTSSNDLLSVGSVPVNSDSDAQPNFLDLDSEGDGIPDTVEARPTAGYVTNDGNVADQDNDFDGVIDFFDNNDGSSYDFGGSFAQPEDTDVDNTPDYLDTDSDDDSVNDSAEIAAAFSPTYADPDGSVTTTLASLQNTDSDATDVDFRSLNDADGDGVPDATDLNAADPCIPNMGGIPTTKDCDGDGNPVATDPNDGTPTATNDSGAAGAIINLLTNDDYLPNNDANNLGTTSIAAIATGTTCTGTPTFSATTGTLVYASAATETSGTCDLVYEVCNTATAMGALPICTTATVTIALADADGDGVPDDVDSKPGDACVPNATGTPGTKDCDGDGNPASSDPDPAAPNATNDTGAPGTPVDLLSNDDFLPNNDAANLGTTSISAIATGTTCTGTPTFDAATGNMTYTSAAGEVSGSCVIEYEVCNTPTGGSTSVCSTAIVTMTLADADGDGIPDSLDTDPADACVPNMAGTPGTKDCDGDGNPASSDPDPSSPNAASDSGTPVTPIDLLDNDDYLPNNDPANLGNTTITGVATGTTCAGSASFNANTGSMTYTPTAGEIAGSCDVVYQVCSTPSGGGTPVCENATVTIGLDDADGDGIPDTLDSDPADACVPNMAGTPGTKDCDGDGNPASSDPDPAAPDASHDAGAAGNPINILANDDYLPNNDPDVIGTTSITQVGGSCTGSVSLNANTGIAVYTASAGDTAASCTVDYEVCSTSSGSTAVCENATITFTIPAPTLVPDTDGDGLADDVDSAPNDACVPNMAGTPGSKDCDRDGNPASTDPDPAAPDASHDAGAAGNPINILANDDYLPNNDPDVIGTTSITQVGGSCTGSVSFNDNTGIAIYTAGAGDTAATCTVDYKVCSIGSTSVSTCQNATITFTIPAPTVVPDTDGDGLTDDVDSAPTDACVPNMTGTPATKDCDGDGHTADNDPDATQPQATNDTGAAGNPINILNNDDYLPNNNPGNTGTTTLDHVGGTCLGNVALDANTGTATYTTGVDDVGTSCTINYRVCNDSSGALVCRQAELTITNSGGSSNPTPNPVPGTDSDGDGIPDSIEGSVDSDGDGVPDYLDLDSDNDGLLDSTELTEDTDNDSVPDYLDLDSDNDGLTDNFEAGGTDANGDGIVDGFTDNNNDGWADSVAASPLPEPDFDSDGFVDYLDLDSDNDGLPDIRESMGPEWDANNDGLIDNPVDTNGDGLAENITANDVVDSDNDSAYNHLDLDSNNDGTFDLVSAGGTDVNGDGQVDTWQDDDGDGIPNSADVDFTGGIDADNDGIDDSVDATFVNIPDSDGDGIIDTADADLQGDGFAPITTTGSNGGKQAASGDIRIGLQGGGCTIASNNASTDPLLPMLMLLSILCLNMRRYLSQKRVQSKRIQGKGLSQKLTWFVIASTCVLSSCSMGRMNGSNPYDNRVATATNPDTQFRRHFYGGAGLGASWLEPDTSEVPGVDVNDRVNGGGQVTLGMDVSKHFSLELHSADLGSAGLSPTGRINYHMHGGSALLYVGKNRHNHVRRGLTGFGRLGYGTLDDSSIGDVNYIENNNTHVLFGGGLEYATRSGLGLRAELISFDADVKYGQLGLIYRMGGRHKRAPARIAKAPPPAPVPQPVVVEQPVALPPVPAVQVAAPDPCAHFTGVLEGVNFHTDSDRLTSQAEIILDGIADELALCPTTPVAISAHTDSQGSDEYNRGLSKRRALSVARHLKGRGINTSRMSARAFGESRPIAPNTTSEGRASNRRVELVAQ